MPHEHLLSYFVLAKNKRISDRLNFTLQSYFSNVALVAPKQSKTTNSISTISTYDDSFSLCEHVFVFKNWHS